MKRVTLWLILLLVPGVLFAQVRPTASFDHFTTGFDLEGAHQQYNPPLTLSVWPVM